VVARIVVAGLSCLRLGVFVFLVNVVHAFFFFLFLFVLFEVLFLGRRVALDVEARTLGVGPLLLVAGLVAKSKSDLLPMVLSVSVESRALLALFGRLAGVLRYFQVEPPYDLLADALVGH